jgi:hypothetical protein
MQKSAKWKYSIQSVPAHSFGFNSSALGNKDDKVEKLVPMQTQLPGEFNGPTDKGVHWGLQKATRLPSRVGFVLDFYMKSKDLPNPTSNSVPTPSTSPTTAVATHSLDFKWQEHKELFRLPAPTTSGPVNFDNKDVFAGGDFSVQNNLFYLFNKSYLLLEINRNQSDGDYFFILITSDDSPKFFKVTITGGYFSHPSFPIEGSIELLSTYNGDSDEEAGSMPIGLKWLRGDNNNHLRLQVRNVMSSIIIENNVTDTPWVISSPVFQAAPVTATTFSTLPDRTIDARGVGKSHIMTMGGSMKIFGGNVACGVSYTHLNCHCKGEIDLDKIQVLGARLGDIGTRFSSFGDAAAMPKILLTEHPPMSGKEKFYYNSSTIIKDADGGMADLRAGSNPRRDADTGGTGSLTHPMELCVTDNDNIAGSFTTLESKITLIAGEVELNDNPGPPFVTSTMDIGKCMSPVLMFARQTADLDVPPSTFTSTDISEIVEDIDLTWQAEEYHSANGSGSMTINIIQDKFESSSITKARTEVINSIGKARYVNIELSLQCKPAAMGGGSDLNEGGPQFFQGIAMNPQVIERAGERHLKFDLVDYWTVLEHNIIINSPYFDGAIDTDVIDHLMRTSGFVPANILTHSGSTDALAVSFSFHKPLEKFDDKTPIAEAIKKYAKRYSKFAFFDKFGKFRYNQIPSVLYGY